MAGRLDVFKDEALTMFVKSMDFQTTAAKDFTVKLICDSLEQDFVSFYQLRSNGKTSPVGRTRHAQYKRDEDLQKLHARFPFITIWDDHE